GQPEPRLEVVPSRATEAALGLGRKLGRRLGRSSRVCNSHSIFLAQISIFLAQITMTPFSGRARCGARSSAAPRAAAKLDERRGGQSLLGMNPCFVRRYQ